MNPELSKGLSRTVSSVIGPNTFSHWATWFLFAARFWEWGSIMTMSDTYGSHHIPLNGAAIKMITTLTIKKYMKSSGNYDSYLVFDLEQLFHRHLFVLGDPPGSVHTPEAATAAVLEENNVIKLDMHEGGAWRQHLIMTLSSNSASRRRGGGGVSQEKKETCFITQIHLWWNKLVPPVHDAWKNSFALKYDNWECESLQVRLGLQQDQKEAAVPPADSSCSVGAIPLMLALWLTEHPLSLPTSNHWAQGPHCLLWGGWHAWYAVITQPESQATRVWPTAFGTSRVIRERELKTGTINCLWLFRDKRRESPSCSLYLL